MVALVVVAFSLAGFSLMRTVGGFVEPGVTVTDQVVRVDQQGVPAYVVPKGWEPGTFIEGSCEVGMPAPAGEPACFVDPYHAVLVVGSRTRMERSPVGALAWDKDSPTAGPVRYQEDVVFWREDTKRDLAFALLVFHRWAPQYGTLFAAVAMDPAEAQTP